MGRDDWFKKWGKHYVGSLLCAHSLQQCNNFKDPGIQHYGNSEEQRRAAKSAGIHRRQPWTRRSHAPPALPPLARG